MGGKVLELESERLICVGKTEGRAEGEVRLSVLTNNLLAAGRLSDIELATNNEESRKKLYKEFGIIDEWCNAKKKSLKKISKRISIEGDVIFYI